MKFFLKLLLAVWMIGWIPVGGSPVWAADDVPLMSIEELKALLGDSRVVIVDVRQERAWQSSTFKIEGAIRQDPGKFEEWDDALPEDKTIVLYCS